MAKIISQLFKQSSRGYEDLKERTRFGYLSAQQFNDRIASAIINKDKFLAGKLGATELRAGIRYMQLRLWQYRFKKVIFDNTLENLSGIFPSTEASYTQFIKQYLEALSGVDCLGVWYNPGEARLISRYLPRTSRIGHVRGLEPYHILSTPWSLALAGKRVLVCTSFYSTVNKQIPNLKLIWSGYKNKTGICLIPDCEFDIVKTPYGFTREVQRQYASWKDVLDSLLEEVLKKNFDVVLVGCGGIGLILCNEIKKRGYPVIYMGGSIQILFGIIGKRWIDRAWFKQFVNDNWTSPLPQDIPSEIGCKGDYW